MLCAAAERRIGSFFVAKNSYIETKGRISTVPSLSRMGQPLANSTAWSISFTSRSI
jgi:hypothetical protein